MGFACRDDEPLLLVGVGVLGDHAAWHAAPVEAGELPVGVLADGGLTRAGTGQLELQAVRTAHRYALRHTGAPCAPSLGNPDRRYSQANDGGGTGQTPRQDAAPCPSPQRPALHGRR